MYICIYIYKLRSRVVGAAIRNQPTGPLFRTANQTAPRTPTLGMRFTYSCG